MSATEIMLQHVNRIRREAEDAAFDYEQNVSEIKFMASQQIDLFGGDAISRVGEIVRKAKETGDNLYSSFQTSVTVLDELCRPLLKDNPESHAIKEAMDLIVWLNKESNVDISYTGTVSGLLPKTDLVEVDYFPSMESLQIEKYWGSAYNAAVEAEEMIKYGVSAKDLKVHKEYLGIKEKISGIKTSTDAKNIEKELESLSGYLDSKELEKQVMEKRVYLENKENEIKETEKKGGSRKSRKRSSVT